MSRSPASRLACVLLLLFLGACGESLLSPPRNLTRPTSIAVVTVPDPGDASPEYVFVVDGDRQQLVMFDTVAETLVDLHPGVPFYNGVFLRGQPTYVAARPDGTQVVVVNVSLGLIHVVCTPLAEACPTPSVIGEVDVGPSPQRAVVIGNRAYVTRPHDGQVVVVDLDAMTVVSSYPVGGIPRGIAASADQSRLYVGDSGAARVVRITLATGEIVPIPVTGPTSEIFVSPNPEFLYAVRADRGSLIVIDPTTEQVIDTNPGAPALTGPELEVPGVVTGMAFERYDEDESFPIGSGQYGFVTTTQGTLYVITTEGDDPHELLDRALPTAPQLVLAPSLSLDGAGLALDETVPLLVALEAAELGIFFSDAAKEHRLVRNENWTLAYEGQIYEATLSRGRLSSDNVLSSPDIRFGALKVIGTDEPMLRDGDGLVFIDQPQAVPGVDCTGVDADETGQLRRWPIRLDPARPDVLLVDGIPGFPPAAQCYGQGEVAYIIRVQGAWAVYGTVSGFQGRAQECPYGLPAIACTPYAYSNLWFSFTLQAGLVPSVEDMTWSFTTSDGVSRASITLETIGAASSLPAGVVASRKPDRRLFVIDQGADTITVVDGGRLTPLLVVR